MVNWGRLAWAWAVVVIVGLISLAIADSWLAGWIGGIFASMLYVSIDPLGVFHRAKEK